MIPMRATTDRIGVGLVLAILAVTVVCYWQDTSHAFHGYDDNLYVTEN